MCCRQTFVAMIIGCGLLVVTVGCQQESTTATTEMEQGPEDSFEEIARMVKEGIEMPGGFAPGAFISHGETGRSQFIVNNTVTSKLVPPTKPNETYRGTITVTSKSSYSLRRSGEGDGNGDESAGNTDGYKLSDDPTGFDAGSSDSGLAAGTANGGNDPTDPGDSVLRRPDEDIRTIDLAYEDDRWVLKSEFDPTTEQSLANAIDRALKFQP